MIKPRLQAHGAVLSRVHRVRIYDAHGEVIFTLPNDVSLLEAEITTRREAGQVIGLLVIDPLGAFLSGETDSYRDASVRRALAPLAQMAERLNLSVIVVMHLNKDRTKAVVQRVGGSGAFANAARSVLALVDDPDSQAPNERIHAAANWGKLGPSLKTRIVSASVTLDDDSVGSYGRMVFAGRSAISVADVDQPPEGASTRECADAIVDALEDGKRPSPDVKQDVINKVGCSTSTLARAVRLLREKELLTIVSVGRNTEWELTKRATDDGGKQFGT
jgi:hypothetical protein